MHSTLCHQSDSVCSNIRVCSNILKVWWKLSWRIYLVANLQQWKNFEDRLTSAKLAETKVAHWPRCSCFFGFWNSLNSFSVLIISSVRKLKITECGREVLTSVSRRGRRPHPDTQADTDGSNPSQPSVRLSVRQPTRPYALTVPGATNVSIDHAA